MEFIRSFDPTEPAIALVSMQNKAELILINNLANEKKMNTCAGSLILSHGP